jgi:transmembrane sensor
MIDAADAWSSIVGETVDESAARWRLKLLEPDISVRDRAAFERWLSDSPQHRCAFDAIDRAWNAAAVEAGDAEMLALREAALRVTSPHAQPKYLRYAAMAITLVLTLAIWIWGNNLPWVHRSARTADSSVSDPILTVQHVRKGDYETRVGERAIIRLVDGTVVTLDTASRATFDLTGRQREIRLLSGQANFEVAKNPEKAFIVYAADRKIIALGTAFDVRLEPLEVKVTLVEGKVAVDQLAMNSHRAVLSNALVRAQLEPGEQLVASIGGGAKVQGTDLQRVTSWRQGRLVFVNDKLGAAVKEMNRYTAIPIVLAEAAVGDLRISGVFRTGQPQAFAHALTEYFAVEATDQGNAVILTWRR